MTNSGGFLSKRSALATAYWQQLVCSKCGWGDSKIRYHGDSCDCGGNVRRGEHHIAVCNRCGYIRQIQTMMACVPAEEFCSDL